MPFFPTDVKPSNILVNFGAGADCRFAEVVLADCGSAVHVDSRYALDGELIGAPIFRSPEAHLQLRWGTATDIWSFGTTASLRSPLFSFLFKDITQYVQSLIPVPPSI